MNNLKNFLQKRVSVGFMLAITLVIVIMAMLICHNAITEKDAANYENRQSKIELQDLKQRLTGAVLFKDKASGNLLDQNGNKFTGNYSFLYYDNGIPDIERRILEFRTKDGQPFSGSDGKKVYGNGFELEAENGKWFYKYTNDYFTGIISYTAFVDGLPANGLYSFDGSYKFYIDGDPYNGEYKGLHFEDGILSKNQNLESISVDDLPKEFLEELLKK